MQSDVPLPSDQVHILIAEDSATQAERLRYSLERRGYLVAAVANGRLALAQARISKPTLVISDIVMPEMDGYTLCRRIKSDSELRNIPVILVTTLSDPQDVIRALECGADNFIVKPYDEGYLLSRVEFVLLNRAVRQPDLPGAGVEIYFNGEQHVVTADRVQILNLLLSTYDAAIERNRELTRTKDALRTANTALEASNKELESFSYSVSHDLRAPLRVIDGFSHMLQEDAASRLSAEDCGLLHKIRSNVKVMNELIEGLLNLSQLGRQSLTKRSGQLAGLVAQVLSELAKEREGRQVEILVGALPDFMGDALLLKQVYVNLLSNALKFTRGKEKAVIEVGGMEQNGEKVYFVRDNGAGFDMRYAQKLFGVFQRLHRADEFEGTGVGLSIVQRIIHRHGGRIWVESEVDKGTTFFFTLAGNSLDSSSP